MELDIDGDGIINPNIGRDTDNDGINDTFELSYKPNPDALDKVVDAFKNHNINLHIDDGCMDGGGSIPMDGTNQGPFDGHINTTESEFIGQDIYNPVRNKYVHDHHC